MFWYILICYSCNQDCEEGRRSNNHLQLKQPSLVAELLSGFANVAWRQGIGVDGWSLGGLIFAIRSEEVHSCKDYSENRPSMSSVVAMSKQWNRTSTAKTTYIFDTALDHDGFSSNHIWSTMWDYGLCTRKTDNLCILTEGTSVKLYPIIWYFYHIAS